MSLTAADVATLTAADVAKLTVPKLKAALEERGLDSSGLKAALTERLIASLSKTPAEPEPPAPPPLVKRKAEAPQ